LLEVLRPYGVLEMVRTGIVAMRRGGKSELPVLPLPQEWRRTCRRASRAR